MKEFSFYQNQKLFVSWCLNYELYDGGDYLVLCMCAFAAIFMGHYSWLCVCSYPRQSKQKLCGRSNYMRARRMWGGGIIFGTRAPLWEQDRNKLLKKYSLLLKRFAYVKEQQKHTFSQSLKKPAVLCKIRLHNGLYLN